MNKKMARQHKWIRRVGAVLMSLTLVCASAFGYQFSPLEQTFGTTGAQTTKTYTIVNDSDDAIAVTITALVRDQDTQGAEVNKPATNYFSIQPNKVIVKARSSQVIRVQYRGPKTVTNELSFRIKAEQIAYNKGRQSSGNGMFNFLYNYITSAYVQPQKVDERLEVASVKPVVVKETVKAADGSETTENVQKLAVTVNNTGNVHQLLLNATLEITDNKGGSVVLDTKEQLGDLLGMNVLAKKRVTINIPMPEGLSSDSGASYEGRIKYSSN